MSLQAFDPSAPSRDLVRLLRTPPDSPGGLPESFCWRVFLELRRRGDPSAVPLFLGGLRTLHRRRGIGTSSLPCVDEAPEEHRLADDPYLADLWRSYKRLVCANRTGPAGQILREFEAHLQAS